MSSAPKLVVLVGPTGAGKSDTALALAEAAQTILLWSEAAFAETGPLGKAGDKVVLRPDIAAMIRAGYDPIMPAVARDASHALRLLARLHAADPS